MQPHELRRSPSRTSPSRCENSDACFGFAPDAFTISASNPEVRKRLRENPTENPIRQCCPVMRPCQYAVCFCGFRLARPINADRAFCRFKTTAFGLGPGKTRRGKFFIELRASRVPQYNHYNSRKARNFSGKVLLAPANERLADKVGRDGERHLAHRRWGFQNPAKGADGS